MSRGKPWAYVGMVVGATVSVAANVAHSYVPPSATVAGWSPQAGAVLLAAFWPLALLLAIEVLAKVAWPVGGWWTLLRFGGVTPVAAVAAIVSYRHLSGLLGWYGEDPITVAIGPAAVDGLMVVSTAALLALASVRQARPVGAVAPIPTSIPTQPTAEVPTQLAAAVRVGPNPTQPDPDGWVARSAHPSVGSGSDGGRGSAGRSGWVGLDDSTGGLGRASALQLVPDRVVESVGSVARPQDVERARQAIRDGKLATNPLTAEAVRRVLNVGLPKARMIRDALTAEGEDQEGHDQEA